MAKFKVKNARLSYPSLFQHGTYQGSSTGKYEATFILDKVEHADIIEKVQAEIAKLQKTMKRKAKNICLKDGDDDDKPEYAGKITLKAVTKRRPLVIDRDRTPLINGDYKPYSGCYVNAIIGGLWCSEKYSPTIGANLDGVQFYADGVPFSAGGASAEDFDAFGDDDDDEF